MTRNPTADLRWVIDAIRSVAKPEGARITEIQKFAPALVETEVIHNYLEEQKKRGVVRRSMNGRWSIVGEVVAPMSRSSTGIAGKRVAPGAQTPAPSPLVPTSALQAVEDVGIPLDDESQRAVVEAPCAARLLVEAGPGFGKTAVACRRVARILEENPNAKVLLLSFTRTAVREVRARIRRLSADLAAARDVEVRTLDSFAGRVRYGLSESPPMAGSFANTIADTISLLGAASDETREYLDSFDHVMVDEAQDLIGDRAKMVLALLRQLPIKTGWTVFLDPAQAIYDWSEDESDQRSEPIERELSALAPERMRLQHLHRTERAELRQLVLAARHAVIEDRPDAYAVLRAELERRAGGDERSLDEVAAMIQSHPARDELLVLVRRRAEAYEVSARLSKLGVPHQLRFGGLPQAPSAWIAAVLNEAFSVSGETAIRRSDIEDAWERVATTSASLTAGWEFEQAWRMLRALGGDRSMKKIIDVRAVAAKLASGTLPDDINRRELGASGPIISTVHGSKGREAAHVWVLLTRDEEPSIGEARVLYVALSRARDEVQFRKCVSYRSNYLPSGRPWSSWTKDGSRRARLEVGCAGDLDALRSARSIASEVEAHQRRMLAFDGVSVAARAFPKQRDEQWGHDIALVHDDFVIAALSSECIDDASMVARKALDQPLRTIEHLRWIDVASAGLSVHGGDSPFVADPWCSTGLLLLPVVVGPGTLFKKKVQG